ncbi:MAG: hypothetical protein DELT_02610 [Desulfovibrio sp.]
MEPELTTYYSASVKHLGTAMLAVQEELEPVVKNATNDFKSSKYATLPKVQEACLPLLRKHGLWLSQHTRLSEPGSIYLVTRIVHLESEEFQESHLIMPAPKNDPQGYGSALTYARRYSVQVAVGVVCEDDDDGNKASQSMAGENSAPVQGQSVRAGKGATGQQKKPAPKNGQTAPGTPEHIPETVQKVIAALPALNGVTYEAVKNDGKFYILAKGKTSDRKQMLQGAGFQPGKNSWYKLAEAA